MTDKPKFGFGAYVYHASASSKDVGTVCLGCDGKRFLTITVNDETFTCECGGCKRGWMGATGRVSFYRYEPEIHEGFVEAIERGWSEGDGFEYRIKSDSGGRWCLKEEDTFSTREEAEDRCAELVEKYEAEQKVPQKSNRDKSWAWHVHYYKRQIRDATKTIEYAQEQLNYAKKLAKESKPVQKTD